MKESGSRGPLVSVPDADRFAAMAREVFASGTLTNNGPLVRELEARLADYLEVDHLVLTSSGTLALQVAYRALELSGEVVTSPFSWITTVSSLCWVGLRPSFADVEEHSFNLDPRGIEAKVSADTSAILAVHSFGNPCDIEAIEGIAARHGLRTIYDAAHGFGSRYRGRGVLSFGDASVLSLHATKLFHCVEGGAVILRDAAACERARLAVNTGSSPDGTVRALGTNGRLSELHAAVGLCLLDNIDGTLRRRKLQATELRAQLERSSAVRLQALNPAAEVNHAYFPIVLPDSETREVLARVLAAAGFTARRYFPHPLNRLPFLAAPQPAMPMSESLASRILCLTLRPQAAMDEVRELGNLVCQTCPKERTSARTARG